MSSRQRAQLAFGSAVILLLLGAAATYVTISCLLIAQQQVSHTHEVQGALANINLVLGKARRAQIEYIDSGDPNFLQAYESAAGQLPGVLQHLRQLTADNPTQRDNCTRLEGLVGHRMALFANSIELRKTGQFDLQEQPHLTHEIVALSAETDSLLQAMEDVEQRLLDLRTNQISTVIPHYGSYFVDRVCADAGPAPALLPHVLSTGGRSWDWLQRRRQARSSRAQEGPQALPSAWFPDVSAF